MEVEQTLLKTLLFHVFFLLCLLYLNLHIYVTCMPCAVTFYTHTCWVPLLLNHLLTCFFHHSLPLLSSLLTASPYRRTLLHFSSPSLPVDNGQTDRHLDSFSSSFILPALGWSLPGMVQGVPHTHTLPPHTHTHYNFFLFMPTTPCFFFHAVAAFLSFFFTHSASGVPALPGFLGQNNTTSLLSISCYFSRTWVQW